jgi:hypothetical protein
MPYRHWFTALIMKGEKTRRRGPFHSRKKAQRLADEQQRQSPTADVNVFYDDDPQEHPGGRA